MLKLIWIVFFFQFKIYCYKFILNDQNKFRNNINDKKDDLMKCNEVKVFMHKNIVQSTTGELKTCFTVLSGTLILRAKNFQNTPLSLLLLYNFESFVGFDCFIISFNISREFPGASNFFHLSREC